MDKRPLSPRQKARLYAEAFALLKRAQQLLEGIRVRCEARVKAMQAKEQVTK